MNADHPNARSIFLAAVESHSPETWEAFLDVACAGDADLRDRVRILLRAHAEANSLLDGLGPAALAKIDVPAPERPGTVIGPYKLLQEIGEGGMGTVFMAEQSVPVQRKVALKIVKPGMDSRQVIARFEAERQALAMMDHPNIAKVLDAGTTDGGRPYFVMELVKGVPITKYCDDHNLTPKERLELFIPVCHAVQHAHQKGIIHRDLKPSNVMVACYDEAPVPKVIDFGVAKATEQKLTERTLFTQFGQLIGTLEYMSPEQATLNALDIDTRSDIYSLGVLLYELLTGSTPLEKKRIKETPFDEILPLIREGETPMPSTRLLSTAELPNIAAQRKMEPAKLSRLVRGDLDWIALKALDKDRNRRFETANAFAADVERYLQDKPVEACPPSATYRLRKFVRRKKGALVIAVCLFLALAGVAGGIGWAVRDRAAREEESEREAVIRRTKLEGQVRDSLMTARSLVAVNLLPSARQKLAEAKFQLGNDRSAFGPLAEEVDKSAAELDQFQEFLNLIDRAHDAETFGAEETVFGLSNVMLTKAGRPSEAAAFLLKALAVYSILERDDWCPLHEMRILGLQQVDQIKRLAYESLLWLAQDANLRRVDDSSGQTLTVKAAAANGLAYLQKAEKADSPTLTFYTRRAACHIRLGNKFAAEADRQRAAETPPTSALDHYSRGQAAFTAKKKVEAVQAFEAALRLEPKHYWSTMKLGDALRILAEGPRDFDAAVIAYSGCIALRPDHVLAYKNRASANMKRGRVEDAIDDYSRMIQLTPNDVNAYASRANANFGLGRYEKTLADYSTIIDLDPTRSFAWNNRGLAYEKTKQWDKALADYSMAIKMDPLSAIAWNNRGKLHNNNLGQRHEAITDYTKAIELKPDDAVVRNNRARSHRALGQWDEAFADFTEAIRLDPENPFKRFDRGFTYLQWEQWGMAIADFTEAIRLTPKDAKGFVAQQRRIACSFAYASLGQWDKAFEDYAAALAQDKKGTLHFENAYFLWRHPSGKLFEKVLADLAKAVEGDPPYADYFDALAYFLATSNDPKTRDPLRAGALAKKAIALNPQGGGLWNTLGMAHYHAREYESSLDAMKTALEREKELNVSDWFYMSMAHWQLGNKDEAQELYTKAARWVHDTQPSPYTDWFTEDSAKAAAKLLGRTDIPKVPR